MVLQLGTAAAHRKGRPAHGAQWQMDTARHTPLFEFCSHNNHQTVMCCTTLHTCIVRVCVSWPCSP